MKNSKKLQRPPKRDFAPASSTDNDAVSVRINYRDPQDGECCLPEIVDNTTHPEILRRIPRLFRYDDAAQEATALTMDIFARATILMASIFLGPALLELASQAVEESCASNENKEECIENGRVYGFKPSSLLSNIAVASGVLAGVTMPFIGAIVDHTSLRWRVGALSALGLVFVKGIEAMVSSRTWLICACLQVVSSLLFNMHITTTYAYTSELSTDAAIQTSYNVYMFIVMYLSTLLFLVWVTVLSSILDQDDVGMARISQITTSTVCAIMFSISWRYLFRERPALSSVPEGQSLISCGFRKVFGTFIRIGKELPALKWLTVAIMFGESATSTLITVATTYMKSFLEMESSQIGLVFLVVLAAGAPGSKLGEIIALRINPIKSAILCNILFVVTTTVASVYLTGPQHQRYVPLVGSVWGLCLGWLHPMHTILFITIIPKEQEAELMGIYILAGQVLSWLPPMLFTALNEAGFDMTFGLASLDVFFLLATVCLFLIGSYEKAIQGHIPHENGTSGDEDLEMNSLEELPPGVHSIVTVYGAALPNIT